MATAMAAQNQSTDSSVFALISAFTNGLDVFKKLRERKAKKKRKQQEELEAAKEEVRLSQSLSRGPMDIRSEYENNYALHGERYREGDANAHASLAAVLLKLNNGLVSIISSFLGNGKKGGKLDYDRLTLLSESSRLEAIDALSQLSFRLSHFRLSTLLRPSSKRSEQDKDLRKKKSRKKQSPTRSTGKQQTPFPIRQIQSSNVSTPQLALLRPRPKPKRTASSDPINSNSKSSGLRSTRSQSRLQSQPMFPPPSSASPARMYSPPKSPPLMKHEQQRKQAADLKSRLAKSTPNLLRPSRGHTVQSSALPSPPPSPYSLSLAPSQFRSPQLPPGPTPTPTPTEFTYSRPVSAAFPRRRRTQKSVASMQTFSSGSTKLGEIPQHKWVQPIDYAEMARLNASAAMAGVPVGQQAEAVAVGQGRRGFWVGLFGKKKKGEGRLVVG